MPNNISVVVTDEKGSVVMRYGSGLNAAGNTSLTIDVSHIPAGLYFLSVSADGFYQSSKILKTF